MPEPKDYDLARLAVERGLISRTQLDEAVTDLTERLEQSENPTTDSITVLTMLIAKGLLQPSHVSELLGTRLAATDAPERESHDLPPEVQHAMSFPDSRFSKYVIVKLLGTGGMGAVYKTWDLDLRRTVALKFLTIGTEDNIRRFIREAQTAARLNHPNIAQVYDAGTHQSRHFITMEFIDGVTLDSLPDAIRTGEIDKIVRIMHDVALAGDYAHSKGIVHRDLKPANVMIDDLLKPHIMDFGLARAVASEDLRESKPGRPITLSGTIVGTPNYIAPEQARGEAEKLDTRTDIYALGATLYALVTGHAPFNGATPLDTIMDVLQRAPTPPTSLNRAVSRDLEAVILRCLEKLPAHRYQSARDLADELQRILAGEPIAARPAGVLARMKSFARRRPVATAMLATLYIVVFVAVLLVRREMQFMDDATSLRNEQEIREVQRMERMARRERAQRSVDDARPQIERLARGSLDPQASKVAGTALDRAIETDGSFPEAFVLRGQLRELGGDLDGAIRDLTRALDLDPDSDTARRLRGIAQLERAWRTRKAPRLLTMLGSRASWSTIRPLDETRADLGGAAADFDRLRATSPFAQGAWALSIENATEAVGPLTRAAELDPKAFETQLLLAIAQFALGRFQDAEVSFGKAVAIRGRAGDASLGLAFALLRRGHVTESKQAAGAAAPSPEQKLLAFDTAAALQDFPKDPHARAWSAYEHLKANRLAEALHDADAAARMRPEGAEVIHALRSRVALARGESELSETCAIEAVSHNAHYGPGHVALAAALWARGRRPSGRESLDRALTLDPDDADAHELDAAFKSDTGDTQGAEQARKRAMELRELPRK